MNEFQEGMDKSIEAHDIEIDIGRIIKRLLHFWWVILILALIGASLMYAYSAFILPPQYKSTSVLYIHDKSLGEDIDIGETDSDLKYNTLSQGVAGYLKSTYGRILTEYSTLELVVDELALENYGVTASSLKGMISYSFSDFPLFDITVTTSDPAMSQAIAETLADVLQSQVDKIVKGSSLTLVTKARVPGGQSGPNTTLNTIIGLAAGLLIGVLILVVIELANNKINNEEYLMQKYGAPVLASITDFELSARKGYGYYKKYKKYGYYTSEAGGNE